MKGGYNGVEERNDHECPVCGRSYQRYIPADSDLEPEYNVGRLCVVVNYGNHSPGGYIHFEGVEPPTNNAQTRSSEARQ